MTPIQQLFLGTGSAVATKTYVDDVFSTYLWKGTAAQKTITNGIDLSTEGGMVWLKSRSTTNSNIIADTERGINKTLVTETSAANDTAGGRVDQFNTDGFRVGNDTTANGSNFEMASWTWRKAPGFFDCVKWQGNGTAGRQISHSLGCVPGLIIIKGTDLQSNWMVYHRDLGDSTTNSGNFHLWLNGTSSKQDDNTVFNDTLPTASNFTVGTSGHCNGNNYNYVAYVFAGGEATDTSRSVEFDGSGDSVSIPDSSDLDFGSGDYTVECWFRQTGAFQDWRSILAKFDGSGSIWIHTGSGGKIAGGFNQNAYTEGVGAVTLNTWNHVAISRSGTSWRLFLNGAQMGSTLTESGSNDNNHALLIGDIGGVSGREFEGQISNVRVV